ncbi:MAG: acyl-CoA dehydratase activase [Firmicutes bacterium]|nr:acyl-CoA dehydratase activase [Bacillota bacterium]
MIGIDLGSRSVKIVQMEGEEILAAQTFDTIGFYRHYGSQGSGCLQINLEELGFDGQDSLVATGYGKIKVQVAGATQLPEIQAHVKGAVFQSGLPAFTLLDLGGQDTKVVKVRAGRAVDFMTNDRCAASSGRYLENMAAILDLTLEELSIHCENPVNLNSTCAIFGETEIIGKIVEGCSVSSLAAGVNYTLYRRCAQMLQKLASEVIVMAGGVALNEALGKIIALETGCKVLHLQQPQLNGAIGCCIYGQELRGGGNDAPDKR